MLFSKKINLLFLILSIITLSIVIILINPIHLLAVLALFFSILFFYFHPNCGIYLMVLFFPFVGLQFFFGQDYNLPLIDIIASLVFIAWILKCFFSVIPAKAGIQKATRRRVAFRKAKEIKKCHPELVSGYTRFRNKFGMTKGFKKSLAIFPGWPIFVLFIAVNLISLFNSYDLFLSSKYILRPLAFFYFAFLVLPRNTINSYKILKNILWIFLSLGIFAAAVGIFSLFLDFGELIPRAKPIAICGWAPLGFNHNALAELLITIIPLNWLLIILNKNETIKKALLLILILMISILLLTFSRTGWICLFLEILLFWYFIYREQTKKLFKKIPSLSFLILTIIFIFSFLMFQLLTSSVGWQANENRLFLNEISYEAFSNHPIIGNGAGTFVSLVRANPAYILEYGQPLDSHGVIQKIAVESGILGLIAFLAFIFYILRKLFLAFKNACSAGEDTDPRLRLNKNIFEGEVAPPRLQSGYSKHSQKILFAFFLVAFASFIFQLFSTSYFIANFWLPIGIALAAVKIIEREKNKNNENNI
jgi:O-antigen ligase